MEASDCPTASKRREGKVSCPVHFCLLGTPLLGRGCEEGGWIKPLQSGCCNGFLGARLDGGVFSLLGTPSLLPAGFGVPPHVLLAGTLLMGALLMAPVLVPVNGFKTNAWFGSALLMGPNWVLYLQVPY